MIQIQLSGNEYFDKYTPPIIAISVNHVLTQA
jgi:hypothetical protein